MPTPRRDPTGGAFNAILGIQDDASEVLESIHDNIESSIEKMDDLQDKNDRFSDQMDDLHHQTKKILKDTNDSGVIGATLLGTEGTGSISDQMSDVHKSVGSFERFLAGDLTGAMLGAAGAAITVTEKLLLLHSILTGMFFLLKLPLVFIAASQAALELIGPIEQIRAQMKLTNDQAVELFTNIHHTTAGMAVDMDKVIQVYSEFASLSELNNDRIEEMAKTTILMSEAWGLNTEQLARFTKQLTRVFEVGPGGLEKVANAMDHVARTTSLTHQEIITLINTISTRLLYRIPKAMREEVMPQMIADIAAIAGAWDKAFGPEAATDLTAGFTEALDIFSVQGNKLKSLMVGLGNVSVEQMQRIMTDGDAGEFFLAQVSAVQNLKAEMGDRRFTETAGIWADQFGVAREELMRMADLDLTDLQRQINESRESLENTKGIREAWDRMLGIFNRVWERIGNIAEALMVAFGEPVLRLILPIVDAFDKLLGYIVDILGSVDKTTKAFGAWGLAIGGVAAAVKSIGLGLIITIVKAIGAAITSILIPAFVAALPILLKIAAVVGLVIGAFMLLKKIWVDFGGPVLEVIGKIVSVTWEWFVSFQKLLFLFSGIGPIIVAVVKYWDEFMEAMRPGIEAIQAAWVDLRDAFAAAMKDIVNMLGMAEGSSIDWFEVLGDGLKMLAKGLGWLIGKLAYTVAGILMVANGLVAVFRMVANFFKTIGEYIGGIVDSIMTAVSGVGEMLGFGTMETVPTPAVAAPVPAAQDGMLTTKEGLVNVHPKEAIIPLERMPEVMGSVVNVHQDAVVDEIVKLRKALERMMRGRGSSGLLAKGAY